MPAAATWTVSGGGNSFIKVIDSGRIIHLPLGRNYRNIGLFVILVWLNPCQGDRIPVN
ncbi:hypothetical protein D3C73_1539460 [compost metagenome]